MIKGFRDFLMRGNVVDLAVAVVIGTAFGGVVSAFARDFIGSILGKIGGKPNLDSVAPGGINIGTTLTALINFLIVAAAVYFIVVVPMNQLSKLRRRPQEEEPVVIPEDIALLTQIRDLLARGQSPTIR
jgi:large conductance mechanosensitive channel